MKRNILIIKQNTWRSNYQHPCIYSGAAKSLARTGRKQTTETEDFDFQISYL